MAAHIQTLKQASAETLQKLINVYYVRTHDGQTYTESNFSRLDFILQWLQPIQDVPFIDDPLAAIKQGARFNVGTARQQNLREQIFDNRLEVGDIIADFSLWPMQKKVWGYKGWDLLQGYMNAADRVQYFEQITSEPANNFLNHTERIFFLTHAYGRPNKYISPLNLPWRLFYMHEVVPTALIALNDILGICPTRQEPEFILERLGDIDLYTIDRFHQGAVESITTCLNQCEPDLMSRICDGRVCFEDFLNSIGALQIIDYNPTYNVFVSNISQLNLYQNVVPGKRWHLEEILDMPNIYVKGILQQLSDTELLNIEAPHVGAFNPNLNTLNARLRQTLLNKAYAFLTNSSYFLLENGNIGYGRPIDTQLDEMTITDLINSIQEHDALIDIYGNVLSVETAQQILPKQVDDIVTKTYTMQAQNAQLLAEMSKEDKTALLQKLQQDQKLNTQEQELMLWSKFNQSYIPVAMDFKTYYQLWYPNYSQIIKDTQTYYTETLTN